jgi:PKD repeat protein
LSATYEQKAVFFLYFWSVELLKTHLSFFLFAKYHEMMAKYLNLTLVFSLLLMCSLQAQTVHKDYWDGQIYLKFKNESNAVVKDLEDLTNNPEHRELAEILHAFNIKSIERPFLVLKTPIFDRTYLIHFEEALLVETLIAEIRAISHVEYAEKVPVMRSTYVPNDPAQGQQYALGLIDAFEAWDIHKGGNATVAIVDDAVYIDHEDLLPNRWENPGEIPFNSQDDDNNGYVDDVYGWDAANNDPDPNPPSTATDASFSHGTHCAGIAAAATDNNKGIASIGFNTPIISVKAKSDGTTGDGIDKAWQGFSYAIASGADVISCSWGGGGFSTTEQNVVNNAYANGQVVVAAAGNDGEITEHYPAAYDHVIAVANTTAADIKAGSSNYGTWVDISAPGTGIYSTLAGSPTSLGNNTGTSMACPMVAGLCALMKSINPFLTPDELEDCIKSSADNIDNLNPTYFGMLGGGRINAFNAIQCAAPNTAPIINISSSHGTDTLCPGSAIAFFDNSFYTPTSWSWTFEGGIPATSSEQNPEVYFPTPGSHNVTLEATNEFGTNSQTYTAYVVVDESGEAFAYYEDFEDGNLGGWTVENDGGTSWGVVPINGGLQYGDYALSINNYDENTYGARDAIISPTMNMYGRTSAVLEIAYAYREDIQSEPDSLIVWASTDGGQTFPHLLFADAENGSYNVATYVLLNGGFSPNNDNDWCGMGSVGAACMSFDITSFINAPDFRVKIENYSRNGNNFYVDNVRVRSNCVSASVVPQADFAADNAGCNTLTTQFFDTSVGVATTWSWSFPGGDPTTSTDREPVVTYSAPGTYEVSLEVFNAAGNDSVTKTDYIVVNDQTPTPNFDFVTSWNAVSFTNTSTGGLEYFWDFGDGNSSTEENPFHQYDELQDYTVTLSVTNGCGTETFSQSVQTTSLEEGLQDFSLGIFPNPNAGQFTIQVDGAPSASAQIEIYDLLGRQLYTETYSGIPTRWNQAVDMSGTPAGTYLVRLEVAGQILHSKLVLR